MSLAMLPLSEQVAVGARTRFVPPEDDAQPDAHRLPPRGFKRKVQVTSVPVEWYSMGARETVDKKTESLEKGLNMLAADQGAMHAEFCAFKSGADALKLFETPGDIAQLALKMQTTCATLEARMDEMEIRAADDARKADGRVDELDDEMDLRHRNVMAAIHHVEHATMGHQSETARITRLFAMSSRNTESIEAHNDSFDAHHERIVTLESVANFLMPPGASVGVPISVQAVAAPVTTGTVQVELVEDDAPPPPSRFLAIEAENRELRAEINDLKAALADIRALMSA